MCNNFFAAGVFLSKKIELFWKCTSTQIGILGDNSKELLSLEKLYTKKISKKCNSFGKRKINFTSYRKESRDQI